MLCWNTFFQSFMYFFQSFWSYFVPFAAGIAICLLHSKEPSCLNQVFLSAVGLFQRLCYWKNVLQLDIDTWISSIFPIYKLTQSSQVFHFRLISQHLESFNWARKSTIKWCARLGGNLVLLHKTECWLSDHYGPAFAGTVKYSVASKLEQWKNNSGNTVVFMRTKYQHSDHHKYGCRQKYKQKAFSVCQELFLSPHLKIQCPPFGFLILVLHSFPICPVNFLFLLLASVYGKKMT